MTSSSENVLKPAESIKKSEIPLVYGQKNDYLCRIIK